MFLGFTLGVGGIADVHENTFLISMTIPIMVLGVPIYDALLAIWRRSVRSWVNGTGGKRGIMQPDVEHLHHPLANRLEHAARGNLPLYFERRAGDGRLSIMFFEVGCGGIFSSRCWPACMC